MIRSLLIPLAAGLMLVAPSVLSQDGANTDVQLKRKAEMEKTASDWARIDNRPVPQWWQNAKFGIFMHWGVYSVPAWGDEGSYSEWYWFYQNRGRGEESGKRGKLIRETTRFHNAVYGQDFHYMDFAPQFKAELFKPKEWAEMFEKSGAKYVVLTSKHHDGFTLWPSKQATESYGRPWNSVDTGPGRDLVRELTEAVKNTPVKMGLYYSIMEWYNPVFLKEGRSTYVDQIMLPQLKELVTEYRPSVLWVDGAWNAHYDEWRSLEFLNWLYDESPASADDVLVNDRWGRGLRKTHGGHLTTEYGSGLSSGAKPWEETRGMGHSFGYNRNETLSDYSSVQELILMLTDIVSRGGNLLLDIGPDADGSIPVIMEERLLQIGNWLKVNGEAIYGTRAWRQDSQWSEGKRPRMAKEMQKGSFPITKMTVDPDPGYAVKQVYFTSKGKDVYALIPKWPADGVLRINDITLSRDSEVTLLGNNEPLKAVKTGKGVAITLPTFVPGQAPGEYVRSIKITNAK